MTKWKVTLHDKTILRFETPDSGWTMIFDVVLRKPMLQLGGYNNYVMLDADKILAWEPE